jgi:predicted nucleic acid-binding protein
MKVLIDTGIFVNVLNGESDSESSARLLKKVHNKQIQGVISTITLSEILSIFYRISERRTMKSKIYVETIVGSKNMIPVFRAIAELAGKIKASYKLPLGDALIVSTAVLTGCDYITTRDREIKAVPLVESRRPEETE